MQIRTWVLAVCLAAAVTARPEGRPPTVDAVRVVESVAPNAIEEQPKAEAAAPKPLLPSDDLAAKPLDEAKKDKEEPAKETEDAMKLPVPIEPDFGSPDDPKVFPEGALRSPNAAPAADAIHVEKPEAALVPTAVLEAAAPAQAEEKDDDKKAGRVARAYLPAEARGDDGDLEPAPRAPAHSQWTPATDPESLGRVLAALAPRTPLRTAGHSGGYGFADGYPGGYSAAHSDAFPGTFADQYQRGGGSYYGAAAGSAAGGAWSWAGSASGDASAPHQLFSERELPDEEEDGYYHPFAHLGRVEVPAQRRTSLQQLPQWHSQQRLQQPFWQPQQQQQWQSQQQDPVWASQGQQLYLDGYGFDFPPRQTFNTYKSGAPAPPQTAGAYGLLDDYDESVPPYKSILATLEGDQFDAALSYGAVPDPQHEPRPYGYGGDLPSLPSVPLAPYPALPAADSFLSSPFGTFESPSASNSASAPASSSASDDAGDKTASLEGSSEVRMEKPATPQPAPEDAAVPAVTASDDQPAGIADTVVPSFEEIQGLATTEASAGEKPLSEDPTEDHDEPDEENQSDSIPDIYVAEAAVEAAVEDAAGTDAPLEEATITPNSGGHEDSADGGEDAASDKPTRLVIKPVAKTEAGEDGIAISMPVSKAVIRGDHPVIVDYDPEVSAVAGANGMAHALGELILTYVNVSNVPSTPLPQPSTTPASTEASATSAPTVASRTSPAPSEQSTESTSSATTTTPTTTTSTTSTTTTVAPTTSPTEAPTTASTQAPSTASTPAPKAPAKPASQKPAARPTALRKKPTASTTKSATAAPAKKPMAPTTPASPGKDKEGPQKH